MSQTEVKTTTRLARPPEVQRSVLAAAVLRTLAYADVFDSPLTVGEIHRYLIGLPVDRESVAAYLRQAAGGELQAAGQGLYTLAGRGRLASLRAQRERASAALWPQARAYGRLLARLPFVRLVAVTGALAVDNARPGDDIDYLVVTAPGRLWLCRALVITVVRWASRRGVELCPNYFLSTRALQVAPRSLYTAHELAQMVPLYGEPVYAEMRRRNAWTAEFLPNAGGAPPRTAALPAARPPGRLKPVAEKLLNTRLGARLEGWEMARKSRKFLAQAGGRAEVSFCEDWCKGHFNNHGQGTLAAYHDRLRRLALPLERSG